MCLHALMFGWRALYWNGLHICYGMHEPIHTGKLAAAGGHPHVDGGDHGERLWTGKLSRFQLWTGAALLHALVDKLSVAIAWTNVRHFALVSFIFLHRAFPYTQQRPPSLLHRFRHSFRPPQSVRPLRMRFSVLAVFPEFMGIVYNCTYETEVEP